VVPVSGWIVAGLLFCECVFILLDIRHYAILIDERKLDERTAGNRENFWIVISVIACYVLIYLFK
jgi:hypothetical protein